MSSPISHLTDEEDDFHSHMIIHPSTSGPAAPSSSVRNVENLVLAESKSREGKDCLENSLQLLQSSLEDARTYDCREQCCTNKPKETTTSVPASGSWWMSLMSRMQQDHEAERKKWKEDLRLAKVKGLYLKEELRTNIEKRIQCLEGRMPEVEDLHVMSGLSRASTATTNASSSSASESFIPFVLPPRETMGVEVTYDNAELMKRLADMERTAEQHAMEKEEWAQALEMASRVTLEGERLSAAMQDQLSTVMEQLDHSRVDKWKEKVRVQKQLLLLMEEQMEKMSLQWKDEKARLGVNIAQLQGENNDLKDKLTEMKTEIEVVRRKEDRRFRAARDEWKRDKTRLEKLVSDYRSQLGIEDNERPPTPQDPDGSMYPMSPNSASRSNNGSRLRSGSASPRSREEMVEKMDRAIAERDVYKEEVEQLRMEARKIKSPSAKSADSGSPGRQFVKMKEREWKEKLEQEIKAVRDEYTAVIEDLEKQLEKAHRYKTTADKRNELVTRVKQLERQRDEEKGEWKLRLEAALADTRKLQKAKEAVEKELDDLRDRYEQDLELWEAQTEAAKAEHEQHLKQLEESYNKLEQQEADKRRESQQMQKMRQQYEREAAELRRRLKDIETLYGKESEEWSNEKKEIEKAHKVKVQELEEMLDAARLRDRDEVEDIKEKYSREVTEWTEQLRDAKDEIRILTDRCTELVRRIDELKADHDLEKKRLSTDLQGVIAQKESRIVQLEVKCSALASSKDEEDGVYSKPLEKLSVSISSVIEDLRNEITSLRDSLDSSSKTNSLIAEADRNELTANLESVQTSLNEVITEMTLGTETMMETKTLAERLSSKLDALPSMGGSDQQNRLLGEIGELRKELMNVIQGQGQQTTNVLQDAIRYDLLEELQKKENELVSLRAQLQLAQQQVEAGLVKLQSAEKEIAALNDQADAYSDEVMRLQALNAGLEETLKMVQQKMETNFSFDDGGDDDDSDSPLLDEALHLAQGLTDLMSGDNKDSNIMDMLQNVSDLMDKHERGEWKEPAVPKKKTRSRQSFISPPKAKGVIQRREDLHVELPPTPVETPRHSPPSDLGSTSSLQLVVDQLYGRCQHLERERTQMMEVTLDLLEAARQANAAELDAALATARRKSMEEVNRITKQNQIEKERLYQRLCGQCVKGTAASNNSVVRHTNE